MGKITFIVGGARSGKSTYALALAKKSHKKVAFIATCQPLDKEMQERVCLHRKSRPADWSTYEEAKDIPGLLRRIRDNDSCLIIDCITILVSNLLLEKTANQQICQTISAMLTLLKKRKGNAIIVSNEVGLGIVPANALARGFRDIAGTVNQRISQEADKVICMISGLPLKLK